MAKVVQCNCCDVIVPQAALDSEMRLFIVDLPFHGLKAERLGEQKIGPDQKWKVWIRLDTKGIDLCADCASKMLQNLSAQWLLTEEQEGEQEPNEP